MLNVLVISNDADRICASYRSGGFMLSPEDKSGGAPQDAERQAFEKYDIAFLDLDVSGWQDKLNELRQQMPVVAFSAPDIKKAVEAMRIGAGDYMEKPLTVNALTEVIGRHKKKILNHKYGFDEITGMSAPMQEVFGLIKRAAASESNVLITGESGTGKELLARAIHRWSPRSERAFMSINCSAIPDTLLESELFGFEKGAFTGANYTKKGLIELAHGGTVFFDEIGDVSPMFQIKVLRVLQEGEIMRVGGMRQIKVDTRVIAATNKDLRFASNRGLFREDLFYRLNVINIHLPPLRERMNDVPLLAMHFVRKHSPKRKDMVVKGIAPDTMKVLMGHTYPGNVRELENIIERAISFTNSPELLPADLPPSMLDTVPKEIAATPKLKDAVTALERDTIIAALKESGGNISRAAVTLGVYRQHLQRKLRSLKISI